MSRRPHGAWTNLALRGFGPIPIVFRQSAGWSTPFRVDTSGVRPKAEFQSRALGKSEGTTELWLKIGAYRHRKPNMLSLHPATERPYLRTGLRLRVTMCVCVQCSLQEWAGPIGYTGFNYTEPWTTCQLQGFLPWGKSSDFCIIFKPGP